MRRLLFALLLPLLVVAFAPAAPVPKHLMKETELYYPTRVGTKWVEGDDTIEVTSEIIKSEKKDDAFHVTVKITAELIGIGKPIDFGTMTVAVSPRGVARIAKDGILDDLPAVWLKLPLDTEKSWDSDTERFTVLAPENVETPAGKFRAIPVLCTPIPNQDAGFIKNGTPRYTIVNWYAPSVGVVKQTTLSSKKVVLKSFTPAKD